MQRTRVRRIGLWVISILIATLMLISYSAAQTKMAGEVNERGAPLFNDLGDHQFAISTKSPEAQKGRFMAPHYYKQQKLKTLKRSIEKT